MITLKRNQAKITLWPTHTHTHHGLRAWHSTAPTLT